MKKRFALIMILVLAIGALAGCQGQESQENVKKDKYNVVATTTMLADLTKIIGGKHVNVTGLMGPGIDPHLYKASAGDVTLMQEADLIVYNGLHLEGKMGEIFENLVDSGKHTVEIAKGLDESDILATADDANVHDPHIWFNVLIWKKAAGIVHDGLVKLDKAHKDEYTANYEAYAKELDELHKYVQDRVNEVPEKSRFLITAHDAFEYFGQTYGFTVKGLQGISTASEAGTSDVRDLADFIVEHEIKAIFIESSVPKKNVEALQEAVRAKGSEVEIGGELHSDSLGSPGTDAETYIGTVKSNIDTIVNALK